MPGDRVSDHSALEESRPRQREEGEKRGRGVAAGIGDQVSLANFLGMPLRQPKDGPGEKVRPRHRHSIRLLEYGRVMETEVRGQVHHHGPAEQGRADLRRLQVRERGEHDVDSALVHRADHIRGGDQDASRHLVFYGERQPGVRCANPGPCLGRRGGQDCAHLRVVGQDSQQYLSRVARCAQHRCLHLCTSREIGDPGPQGPHEPERGHPVARHDEHRVVPRDGAEHLADAQVVQRGGHAGGMAGKRAQEAENT